MYICIMENDYLKAIASVVLPAQILDYFIVVGVEQTKTEIHISLDECNNKELSEDIHFESKGFMEPVNVTDFPIRDHKVILRIRRRRWIDTRTGKSFSMPIDLDIVAKVAANRYKNQDSSGQTGLLAARCHAAGGRGCGTRPPVQCLFNGHLMSV